MTLKHANVVKFKDSWICGDEMWIVTEFMEGGTLSQAIKMHVFDERYDEPENPFL